ncbi:DUF3413 domain-containing protein [Catenovulum sediminis]|uniref:DUF3413 domain-containing protein n=1 Tax=Catenovulum sediminis TaxID=1740262 RepID=A0ABV1RLK5_9ALTE|nr:DUF3413 domain-containing protein [Catenovulum sediminis]
MLLNSASQQKSKLYSWGHWFGLTNMLAGLFLFFIYWFAQPLPATGLGVLYMVIYSIGHAGFLFFVGHLLLVFPFTMLNKPNWVKPWAAFVAALGLTLLFIDALVYSAYGYHINLLSVDYIQNDFQLLTQALPAGFKAALLLVFIAVFSVELVLANSLWRSLDKYRKWFLRSRVIPFVIVCFLMGHLAHIWADLTLYKPITRLDNQLPLSHPMTAKTILSQSGLVDLDEYKQKKQFSFDVSSFSLDVPNFQFSCFAPTKSLSIDVIYSTYLNAEQITSELESLNSKFTSTQHWAPLALDDSMFEIISGLPAIYNNSFAGSPNVLDSALLSTSTSLTFTNIPAATQKSLPEFEAGYRISDSQLNVSLYKIDNLSQLSELATGDDYKIIAVLPTNAQQYGQLLVLGDLVSLPDVTSNLDIMPTILEGWLSCSFPADYGKFGHNLFSVPVKANWLVSADAESIYVWHKGSTTKITGDAQMTSTQMLTQQTVEPPSNATLIRAIHFLKRNLVNK